MVVREPERFSVSTEHDARIADVSGVENSLTGSRFLEPGYGVGRFEAGGGRVRVWAAMRGWWLGIGVCGRV